MGLVVSLNQMTPDRWEQIKELFDAALERPRNERADFLVGVCPGDDSLVREVEHLLAQHDEAGEFLNSPPWAAAGEKLRAFAPDGQASDKASSDSNLSVPLLKPGDIFATRYEIKGELGRGGFGIVYSASDRQLERTVALKVIRVSASELSARASAARQRFLEEARVAANLSHSNIATVFDVGESSGCVYMTQEQAPGRDLRKILAESGPLPLRRILAIGRQICEGLAHAHGRAIVHRDIKPGNIVVSADDRTKITDFGLAQPPQTEDATMHQIIAGTPGYMAPEQLRGDRVDGRADIFAVGCVLYQMLTGRKPFEGTTTASTIEKTLYTFPPEPSLVREDLPHTLDRVVARAMKKDPDDRYNNVTQLQQDLLNHEQFGSVIDAKAGAAEIASALEARKCTLFVGLCLPVTLNEKRTRTVESLISDYLAERLSGPARERSLSRLAQDLETERGRPEMLKYLTAAVRNPSVSPREIIGEIARLRFPVIVTTGYDSFLEQELSKVNTNVRRVLDCHSVPDDSPEADLLVRLFGSLDSESSVVVTEDDLWDFFGAFNSLSDALKSRFAHHCLLFIGYDPEDEGFKHLFAAIARFRVGVTEGCYLATPDIAILPVRWAQKTGLKLIDANPAPFLSLVEQSITEMHRQQRAEKEEAVQASIPKPPNTMFGYVRKFFLGKLLGLREAKAPDGKAEPVTTFHGALTRLRGGLERLSSLWRPSYLWPAFAGAILLLALAAWLTFRPAARHTVARLPPAPPPGTVRLDVSPWGELKEVRDLKTQQRENVVGQITPLELPLPAGDYEVVVDHPTLGSMKFTLHVDAGKQQEIRKSFPAFDPDNVLKTQR